MDQSQGGQAVNYITRTIKWAIMPKNEPIFSDRTTEIEIEDEGGGEFVVISQHQEGYGKIALDSEEWPSIRAAIDLAVEACRKEAKP